MINEKQVKSNFINYFMCKKIRFKFALFYPLSSEYKFIPIVLSLYLLNESNVNCIDTFDTMTIL